MAKNAKDSMAKLREDRKAQGLKNYNLWLQPELLDAVAKPGETIAETISRALQTLAKEDQAQEGEPAPKESEPDGVTTQDSYNYLKSINEQLQSLASRVAALEQKQVVLTTDASSEKKPAPEQQLPLTSKITTNRQQLTLADFPPEAVQLFQALAEKQTRLDAATRRSALLEAIALAETATNNLAAVGHFLDSLGITPVKGGNWKTAGKINGFYNPNRGEVSRDWPTLKLIAAQ